MVLIVSPGQSTTYTVALAGFGGFRQTVSFIAAKLLTGVSSSQSVHSHSYILCVGRVNISFPVDNTWCNLNHPCDYRNSYTSREKTKMKQPNIRVEVV